MLAQVVVGYLLAGLGVRPQTIGEDRVAHLGMERVGRLLLLHLFVVEQFHEEQIGHLLHDGQRVGDACRPERLPQRVNLVFNVSSYHEFF